MSSVHFRKGAERYWGSGPVKRIIKGFELSASKTLNPFRFASVRIVDHRSS